MLLPGGAHLGYCTNVHPSESLDEVHAALDLAGRVRAALGVDELGLGVYLSAGAARAADPAALAERLAGLGLYAFTLNGFPYGGFHAGRVKEAVYRPDWTDPARAEHTLRLAALLEGIAPPSVEEPTISTVPLGWRIGWSDDHDRAAAAALVAVARELRVQAHARGRAIRLCLEPEPGCAVETAAGAAAFFGGPLAEAAGADADAVRDHLGVCYDVCHQAVMHESPEDVLRTLADAGVTVGKVQLSAALELRDPADAGARAELAAFDEPRYLHQACAGDARADDLPEALAEFPRDRPWRVHFHVPIDGDPGGAMGTTRDELERAAALLRASGATRHYEVETYTWSVLPEGERPDGPDALAAGVAREVAWAREALR
jgi:sugar phosphate isomerase/epimerase